MGGQLSISLRLNYGTSSLAIEDGDTVDIECGREGGYYFPTDVVVNGNDVDYAIVEMAAFDRFGQQVGFGTNTLDFSVCNVASAYTFLGDPQGVGSTDVVEGLMGKSIRLKATVTVGSQSATHEVTIVPVLDCTRH